MAHNTFISYKYSEARDLRDKIILALGDDAFYYKGETSDSPNLTDLKTETIKQHLKDMMYDTSVTIVIISPHMKESNWIDWELEYCLKKITRKNRTSQRNGIVGVIQKVYGSYDWFIQTVTNGDGCIFRNCRNEYLYDIIRNNRFNQNPVVYTCEKCKTVDILTGSYIALIKEEDFLANPDVYINNAYVKSESDASGYDISITR